MAYEITALGSPLEVDSNNGSRTKLVRIDATHYLQFNQGASGDGFARIIELDGSGNLSLPSAQLEFDTADASSINAVLFDGVNHVLVVWQGADADGFAQILTVNLTTWALSLEGSPLEFNLTQFANSGLQIVDSTHAIVAYNGPGNDGFIETLVVNLTTWAVTEVGTQFEFDIGNAENCTLDRVNNDPTRYLLCYRGVSDDGFALVVTVDTSVWSFTVTSSLEFDTGNGWFNRVVPLDATHFLLAYIGPTAATILRVEVLFVNPSSSYAISELGTLDYYTYPVAPTALDHPLGLLYLDDDASFHYAVLAFRDGDLDGWLQTFAIDKSTFAIAAEGSALEFDGTQGNFPELAKVSDTRVLVVWQGTDDDCFAQAFDVAPEGAGDIVDESLEDVSEEEDAVAEQQIASVVLAGDTEDADEALEALIASEIALGETEDADETAGELTALEELEEETEESDVLLGSTLVDQSLEEETEETDELLEALLVDVAIEELTEETDQAIESLLLGESLSDLSDETDELVDDVLAAGINESIEDETEEADETIEQLLASVGLLGEVEEEDEILETVVSALGETIVDESEESDAVLIEIVRNVTGGLYRRSQGQWHHLFGS